MLQHLWAPVPSSMEELPQEKEWSHEAAEVSVPSSEEDTEVIALYRKYRQVLGSPQIQATLCSPVFFREEEAPLQKKRNWRVEAASASSITRVEPSYKTVMCSPLV